MEWDGYIPLEEAHELYGTYLNRMIQPDTIVPDYTNPQSLNRYSYVLNNPLKYTDPTGHTSCPAGMGAACSNYNNWVGATTCAGGMGAACSYSQTASKNKIIGSTISATKELPPAPVVELQPPPNGMPFDAKGTWGQLEDNSPDLLARGILSEVGARVLNPNYRNDVRGVGWVLWNRTRSNKYYLYARGSLYEVLVADDQVLGMLGNAAGEPSNAARAANPEAYDSWYGGPGNGREAYWAAFDIASDILNGTTSDPTNGALQFYDAGYVMDANGNIALDVNGNKLTTSYEHTHFGCYSGARSYTLDDIQALSVTC